MPEDIHCKEFAKYVFKNIRGSGFGVQGFRTLLAQNLGFL
jgi:hypothetical protein